MKKVGIIHFFLTVFLAINVVVGLPEIFSRAKQPADVIHFFWIPLWATVMSFLQPITALIWKIVLPVIENNEGLLDIATVFSYLLVPIWSAFFGWLFVKVDDWLNHFPVLGKRVF